MERFNKATYVSNAGLLLELYDKKILIDGFCNSALPIYKNPTKYIREKMILGSPPFNNIDILLFTHHHSDHFDVKSTGEFLKNNKDTFVLSTPKVIDEIKKAYFEIDEDRLFSANPQLYSREDITLKGICIQSISMLHEGKEYEDVQNLGFLIEVEEKKVCHVGDAKAIKENYMDLDLIQKNIDLLAVPFPYVGVHTGRQVIEKYIAPKKVAAIHWPYRELDNYGWIDATKKSFGRVQDSFAETVFLEEIETAIII